VTRGERQRLGDIEAACLAIHAHLERGELDDGLVFDAVRIRLLEIGEAVKGIDPGLLSSETEIPWRRISRMRDHLAHRYFDTAHSVIQAVVDEDIAPLLAAVRRLSARRGEPATQTQPTDLTIAVEGADPAAAESGGSAARRAIGY
jgi:uncharacterized protein with HEPN domain